jgi:hypothetical protein
VSPEQEKRESELAGRVVASSWLRVRFDIVLAPAAAAVTGTRG